MQQHFRIIIKQLVFVFLLPLCVVGNAYGENEEVGKIVAIKGNVIITRNAQDSTAMRESPLYLLDRVETKEAARVKMRFVDDSVLTLSGEARLFIKDYLYGRAQKEGGSIFELIDGQLRTLVGQGDLEIHTPTAVAAARGTFFFVRVKPVGNLVVTEIFLLEGTLEVRNKDKAISGKITLKPGMSTRVETGMPPEKPMQILGSQLKDLLNCCSIEQGK